MKDNEELRQHGYLTIDEWVEKLSNVVSLHLKESVWPKSSDNEVFHPEDLASNTAVMMDALMHVLPEFGEHNK